jgi:hypothetical protein
VNNLGGVRASIVPRRKRELATEPAKQSVNPFLFICGCLRSGTTLARRIFDAHRQLAIVHETQWLPRVFEKRKGVTEEGMVTPELISRLAKHPRFARLNIEPDEMRNLMGDPCSLGYAEFVSRLFDLYGYKHGKPLVGEKSPGYVRHIQTLNELWPNARFVHVIRDGRDVSLSVLNWKKRHKLAMFSTWAQDPVSTIALWWEWHVRMGLEDGSELGGSRYRDLYYEALVQGPARECKEVCVWLGLVHDEGMLSFHEGQRIRGTGNTARGPGLPVTAGLRSWRGEMPRGNVLRFEAICGALLEELGYERSFTRVPSPARDAAARMRRDFATDLRDQRRAAPRVWADAS